MGAVVAALVRGALPPRCAFVLICANEKGTALRVAELRECVDPGTARITKAEEFGDLVEGFACGVINSAADESVRPCSVCWARKEEVRVTAGDDEGEGLCIRRGGCGRCSLAFLKEDRVNVAFEMINGDEGKVVGESEGFGVGDADEQCTSEARARSDGNGIEIGEVNVGFSKRGADNGNDGAKVLAAGELGHDAAVERVGRDRATRPAE